MSWKYPDEILHRKLKFLDQLANPDAIDWISNKWINLLKDIQLEISFEVIYRLLEELYLMLNAGFNWDDFDFPPLPDDFDPGDIVTPPIEGGTKAYYDQTYWDDCYWDPPGIQFKDLERFAWDTRYHVSETEVFEYKKMSKALKDLLVARRSGLEEAGIASWMANVVEDTLSMVESRILRGFYVGFAIVGLSTVQRIHPEDAPYRTDVDARDPADWKTVRQTESVISWEAIVGWCHVSYFRVGAWYQVMNKTLSDKAVERINDFWLRSGLVEAGQLSKYGGPGYTVYGTPSYGGYVAQKIQTLYPRIFMLQRIDQYHYAGGAQQLRQGILNKKVRPILDKAGIIANMRSGYYAYAREIYYLQHDSHRLYKTWRKLVTEADITAKYVQIGCDSEVLNKVKRAIGL